MSICSGYEGFMAPELDELSMKRLHTLGLLVILTVSNIPVTKPILTGKNILKTLCEPFSVLRLAKFHWFSLDAKISKLDFVRSISLIRSLRPVGFNPISWHFLLLCTILKKCKI